MRRINHSSRFIAWSSEWKSHTTIRDLVDTSADKASRKFKPEDIIRYIDISSVDGESNSVIGTTEYIFSEAPSRAQQCTRKGDILVSTVRPNLKNIAVNQLDEDNLVASSGFCVLRPKEEYSGLILAYVLSEPFTLKMVAEAKGSNYPAIHDSDILDYPITVPESHELASVGVFVQQADKSKFSDFKSRFIEMFGTLDSPKVPVKRMIEVSKASGQYGLNASAVNYIEGKPRYIRITDICDDGSLNDDIKCSDIDDSTYSVNKGDVLFARTGATVGKTYLHRSGDACFAGYLIRYSFTEAVDPEYILAYTHSDTYYDWVLKSQKVGAQPNISASQYDNMPILIPGRKEQEAFLCLYRQADKSKYLN